MPRLTAAIVFSIVALTLLWPLLTGHILFGGARSDMYIAGYSFRLFGAATFKATGSIPQWNPYLFGGLPYIAAMHGDIFYPTAWLRLGGAANGWQNLFTPTLLELMSVRFLILGQPANIPRRSGRPRCGNTPRRSFTAQRRRARRSEASGAVV